MASSCSRHIIAWWSVNRPSSAIARSAILAQARPMARSAITAPRRSPSMSAPVIAVGPLPVIAEATEPSLMPADSSVLPSRWTSEVRAWTFLVRSRVRSRTSFSSGGGM
jgi:hypothetical protein